MGGSAGSAGHRLGEVSYAMLVDALGAFSILRQPRECTRRFSWFATVYDEDDVTVRDFRSDTLFLCHEATARRLMERFPNCFCIILIPDGQVPAWLDAPTRANRAVVVAQEGRLARYDLLLRELFVSNLVWENAMDRVVYSHGRLDRLIGVSEASLGNFTCITDTGHNLIAYSRGIEPPAGSVWASLVENGCYSADEIAFIEEEVLPASGMRSHLVACDADAAHPYPTLHYPVYIDGSYLFHITMVCATGSPDLLRDRFRRFMRRVIMLCTDFWRQTVNLEAPWHRVFIGLIKGEKMTEEYVNIQLAKTAVPAARRFRLLYFPFSSTMSQADRATVVEAARGLNGGECYPFMLEDQLIVLLHTASQSDLALSGQSVWDELATAMLEPFGMQAGASQVFRRITDIEKAYREAFAAYSLRGPLKREYEALLGQAPLPCFPFEHALKFYLLTEGHDDDLVEFAFDDCILNQIMREDREAGTAIAQMLWVYLSHGRNATETAKLSHVHRNTVLYHLGRIEKRFGISFDSPLLRSRMVLDCQRLLLVGDI
ncbi:MAG: PucR family transcriptional regulator [Eggerthellaceae bacterium]|nr:PucR family transcriptional regulator [Eggerthellaceae bacterium]